MINSPEKELETWEVKYLKRESLKKKRRMFDRGQLEFLGHKVAGSTGVVSPVMGIALYSV